MPWHRRGISAACMAFIILCVVALSACDSGVSEPSPYFRFLTPHGETLTIGSIVEITWDARDIETVDLFFSDDNGETWCEIGTDVNVRLGVYEWIVPEAPESGLCLIEAREPDESALATTSRFSTLMPGLRLTADLVNKRLIVGDTLDIPWHKEAATAAGADAVKVELYRSKTKEWETLASGLAVKLGHHAWKATQPESGLCKIRLTDPWNPGLSDESGEFIIAQEIEITSPLLRDVWKIGSEQVVKWQARGISWVRIELSRDDGGTWEELRVVDGRIGYASFIVTEGAGGPYQPACWVRLSDAEDGTPASLSLEPMAIRHEIRFKVDDDALAGGDGLSWETALVHPALAMELAVAGDEVWMAEGTYGPLTSGDTEVLAMWKDVHVYGGFAGGEVDLGMRDPATNECILDGEGTVETVVACADGTVLDGFVITGGGRGAEGDYVNNVTVENCRFTANTGGCANFAGCTNVKIVDCSFEDNSSDGCAGIRMTENSSCWISGSTFVDNSGRSGVAIDLGDATGGITDCSFIRNTGSTGGAVKLGPVGAHIRRCLFQEDRAGMNGGALEIGGSWQVSSCRFIENSSISSGGAVYVSAGAPAFANCVFVGNTSYSGGAIAVTGCTGTAISFCTLWCNTASLGGAVDVVDGGCNIESSIIWNGIELDAGQVHRDANSSCSVSYSDIQLGYSGTGNIGHEPVADDPQFVDPAGPDGVTGTADDDLHLVDTSPCVDAASPNAVPSEDLEGNPRPVGGARDMGAYEYQVP